MLIEEFSEGQTCNFGVRLPHGIFYSSWQKSRGRNDDNQSVNKGTYQSNHVYLMSLFMPRDVCHEE